jgi:type II secretory ATPase GspE/PulE/Tfp pilus assembly ATPase PilB-like protein
MAEKVLIETARKTADVDPKQMRSAAEDKNVVQEVDSIVSTAVAKGAMEIHFEPQPDGYVIRVRDGRGMLAEVARLPEKLKANVANRLKVVSGMDITKNRIPQSGFFRVVIEERKIELYVYILPTIAGEAVTVKISYKQSATLRLTELGLHPNVLAAYKKTLARGAGLYLLTGPPGSGKRTTIYSSILEVVDPTKLAMGFDPVIKYEIPGMIQGKQEERSEYSFADAITALMRQEPDIAYIGDVSCEADARATIQGAFSKRLVFARMTANDTLNAIQNLVDMGIQPFLIAASLTAVMNQRLVRRLCTSCREPYAPDESISREVGFRLPEGCRFFRAKGCAACGGGGFAGVVPIFELYRPSEELNKMIVAKEPIQSLRNRALQEGMYSLKMDGVSKALGGMVTLEDVLNAL